MKNLKELVAFMRDNGVRRCAVSGIEVELQDAVFSSAVKTTLEQPDDDVVSALSEPEEICVCGHPVVTQHSPDGCLHGCPVSVCETVPSRKPEV